MELRSALETSEAGRPKAVSAGSPVGWRSACAIAAVRSSNGSGIILNRSLKSKLTNAAVDMALAANGLAQAGGQAGRC